MANFPLRLPESVRKAAEIAAAADGVSLNQFFATAIAEKSAVLNAEAMLRQRAERANKDAFDAVLARIGPLPPVDGDMLTE